MCYGWTAEYLQLFVVPTLEVSGTWPELLRPIWEGAKKNTSLFVEFNVNLNDRVRGAFFVLFLPFLAVVSLLFVILGMVLELHVWGPAFGLPSIDPQCLAAIAYFSLAIGTNNGRPGEWVVVADSDPGNVPTRMIYTLPYLPCLVEDFSGQYFCFNRRLVSISNMFSGTL